MFTWICPQCGREVLPSYTECPDCSAKTAAGAPAAPPAATAGNPLGPAAPPYAPLGPAQPPAYAPPPPMPPPAAQPVYQPAPQQPMYQPAPQPVYQQPPVPQYAVGPRPSSGLPTWLLTILFAFAFVGLVAGVYWIVGYFRGGSEAATPAATVESPAAAKPGTPISSLQKYIEISGVRFAEDAKKNIVVKFMLTNHSDADVQGLAGNATIWARTQKSEEDTVGTFSFSADIPPQASKELSAPLTTKLKVYELPDWQNVTTDVQITAPQ